MIMFKLLIFNIPGNFYFEKAYLAVIYFLILFFRDQIMSLVEQVTLLVARGQYILMVASLGKMV